MHVGENITVEEEGELHIQNSRAKLSGGLCQRIISGWPRDMFPHACCPCILWVWRNIPEVSDVPCKEVSGPKRWWSQAAVWTHGMRQQKRLEAIHAFEAVFKSFCMRRCLGPNIFQASCGFPIILQRPSPFFRVFPRIHDAPLITHSRFLSASCSC